MDHMLALLPDDVVPNRLLLEEVKGMGFRAWSTVTHELCFGCKLFICCCLKPAVAEPIIDHDLLNKFCLLDNFSRLELQASTMLPLVAPSIHNCQS
jgi:hypothetical protein